MKELSEGTRTMEFIPKDAEFRTRVKDSFNAQGMMHTLGARLSSLSAGHCTISAPVRPGFSQQHGFAHAGLTFAIGDSAAGYAAFSLMSENQEVLTVEMKINLINPARGTRLEATGKVLRPGNRLTTVQSDVYALEGESRTHVAVMLGTMVAVKAG